MAHCGAGGILITAGSRIHVSLADMGRVSPRAYGGVGFMVDRTCVRVEVRRSDAPELQGKPLDPDAQKEVLDLIAMLLRDNATSASVTVHQHSGQHVGFGSKTALKLSVVVGLREILELQRSRKAEQMLSGRGGASGIGLHGFYEGGVLWDVGRPSEEVEELVPSRARPPIEAPLLMLRLPFPTQWQIGLCLPSVPTISGEEERRFFELNAPIESGEAQRAMALLYHGVLPAFASINLSALAKCLFELSRAGFKRLEIERCGPPVKRLLEKLYLGGHAAGMSSMGPLVYVIIERDNVKAAQTVSAICATEGAEWLGWHAGLNRGVTIEKDGVS